MKKTLCTALCFLFLAIVSCQKEKSEKKEVTPNTEKDTVFPETKSVSKATVGDSLLVLADLNIVSSLSVHDKTDLFENGMPLTKHLSFELVDKSFFGSKKKTAVHFLLADTIPNKKQNGTTTLAYGTRTKKFIDKPEDNDGMEVFHYVGQFDFLNKYLVGVTYYEGGDYFFIDKSTGEKTNTFVDFPTVSPNKKHIISIHANGYESTADLELYAVTDQKVKRLMSASFKNWMPLMENEGLFWAADDYLYVAVHNTKHYWKQDGSLNDNYQFIRIKVL